MMHKKVPIYLKKICALLLILQYTALPVVTNLPKKECCSHNNEIPYENSFTYKLISFDKKCTDSHCEEICYCVDPFSVNVNKLKFIAPSVVRNNSLQDHPPLLFSSDYHKSDTIAEKRFLIAYSSFFSPKKNFISSTVLRI